LKKLYQKVHANIKADPTLKKKTKKVIDEKDLKKRPKKKSLSQRRKDIQKKKTQIIQEITKKRAEQGLLPKEDEVGVVKVSKKDRVKQISTKKPKAAKGAEGGKDAKKGGAKDAKKDPKAKPDAKAGAKPDAKAPAKK